MGALPKLRGMRRSAVFLCLLSLCLLASFGCRHRPKPAEPVVAPPVATATSAPELPAPVETRDRECQQPAEPRDVLSADIVEADRVAHQRGWIRDAFYGFDASTLDADAQEALRQSATWLRDHPEFTILVEGHCDERGTEQYNLALGDRRAESAISFLAAAGVDRDRIRSDSYGEQRPFAEGSNEEAWHQNRRAHIVLSGRR